MYGGYEGLENENEEKILKNAKSALNDIILTECDKRCPNNQGYEPKCEHCDVEYFFRLIDTHFKMKGQKDGLYYALRWLLGEKHNQFEDDDRNRNLRR